MTRKTAALGTACGALAGLVSASIASADSFNDLGAFLAAAPGATLVNFDTLPGGGPAVLGPIGAQYAAVGLDFPPANEIIDGFGGPVSPPNGWLNNTFVGADPTFDVNITVAGVRAAGVHNVLFASPNGAILRAFDAAGAELESVRSDADGGTLDFFGVTTTADIARVVISVINAGGWGLDDLYVGAGGGGCYADCDESGELDFFDFLCFQNEFAAGTAYADCDGSGQLDFFDFLCFQNEFAAGCP
jgi:hypothetical protein